MHRNATQRFKESHISGRKGGSICTESKSKFNPVPSRFHPVLNIWFTGVVRRTGDWQPPFCLREKIVVYQPPSRFPVNEPPPPHRTLGHLFVGTEPTLIGRIFRPFEYLARRPHKKPALNTPNIFSIVNLPRRSSAAGVENHHVIFFCLLFVRPVPSVDRQFNLHALLNNSDGA